MTKRVYQRASVAVSVVLAGMLSSYASATPDDCTGKLERYLKTLKANASSEHISPRQREAAQTLLDKAARLRKENNTDCAVFDKLLF